MKTTTSEANAKKEPVINDPDDMKGVMKHIGGSQSDNFNRCLATQATESLWLPRSRLMPHNVPAMSA
jgi:hypothetical protein